MGYIPDLSETCFVNLYLFVPDLKISPLVKISFFFLYFWGPAGIAQGRPGGSQPLLSGVRFGLLNTPQNGLMGSIPDFSKT